MSVAPPPVPITCTVIESPTTPTRLLAFPFAVPRYERSYTRTTVVVVVPGRPMLHPAYSSDFTGAGFGKQAVVMMAQAPTSAAITSARDALRTVGADVRSLI